MDVLTSNTQGLSKAMFTGDGRSGAYRGAVQAIPLSSTGALASRPYASSAAMTDASAKKKVNCYAN